MWMVVPLTHPVKRKQLDSIFIFAMRGVMAAARLRAPREDCMAAQDELFALNEALPNGATQFFPCLMRDCSP
jgi:hypothetical protein